MRISLLESAIDYNGFHLFEVAWVAELDNFGDNRQSLTDIVTRHIDISLLHGG